jgi:hypothetical protein
LSECAALKKWALIRHAGSAPEASIDSKPLGSELVCEYKQKLQKVKIPETRFGEPREI